jgi:hypothetical protein
MVLGGAANSLLGAEAAGKGYTERDEATGEKRTKLRRYEHIGAQVLNVAGVSPIHECSNKALWTTAMKGSKTVAFHSEFCSNEAYRQGVAGSRHAETMLALGAVLEEGVWDAVLDATILAKVKGEFAEYKPMLEVLNGGKASQTHSKSLFVVTQKKDKKAKDAVKQAAGKVYQWLQNEKSAVRGFLQIMSWGGIFYSAMCSDKIARCAVDPQCGAIGAQDFEDMMVARLCGDGPVEEDDNSNAMARVSASLLVKK